MSLESCKEFLRAVEDRADLAQQMKAATGLPEVLALAARHAGQVAGTLPHLPRSVVVAGSVRTGRALPRHAARGRFSQNDGKFRQCEGRGTGPGERVGAGGRALLRSSGRAWP